MSDRWYDRERSGRMFDQDRRRGAGGDEGHFNDWNSRNENRHYGQEDYMDRERPYGRERGQRLDVPMPPWSQEDRRMYNDYGYGRQGDMYDDRWRAGNYGRQSEAYGERGYGYGREGQMGGQGYGREGQMGDRWQSGNYGRQGQIERGRGFGQDYDSSMYDRGYGNQEYGSQGSSRPSWSYTEVWFIPGPFSGQGPKGYQRSDERIQEEVCERLTQHGHIDARNIEVKVQNGEVTLDGTVNDRQTKRLAEDVVDSLSGVREIHNNLRVQQHDQGWSQQGGQNQQYGQSRTSGQSQYGASTSGQNGQDRQRNVGDTNKQS